MGKGDFARVFDGEPVLQWRAERLHAAGFTREQAVWLAECRTVDLHQATDMLREGLGRGVSREVIFDVLAE
jgi:hypothetical protein